MKKKARNPLCSEKWINKKTGVEVKADTHSDGDVEVTISGAERYGTKYLIFFF